VSGYVIERLCDEAVHVPLISALMQERVPFTREVLIRNHAT